MREMRRGMDAGGAVGAKGETAYSCRVQSRVELHGCVCVCAAPERIPAVCKAQERHRLCEQQPVKREHREAEPRRGVSNREPRAHGRTHFQYELVNAACSEV